MKRFLGFLLAIGLLLPLLRTSAQIEDPATLRLSDGIPGRIDPAQIIVSDEVNTALNLFVTLVRNSPTEFGLIEPALAERWEVNAEGDEYTFYLRADVPWVYYDPDTEEIIPLRLITAEDVVYSVRRVCSDWRNGYYAVDVFGPVIVGCERALDGGNPAGVGVEALDEHTVRFTLTAPGSYFLSMATMWTLSPVPREGIEAYGDTWTEIGNLITSGAFVLAEWDFSRMVFLRNPYLPDGLGGDGNVERVEVVTVGDTFGEMEAGNLDRADDLTAADEDTYPDQVYRFRSLLVSYLGISNDKPPMDDVHVRRAFAAAINRREYIEELTDGAADPMYHFIPDPLFGGVPSTEIGIGYDLAYAREQLEAAGYPNCEGMPTIEIDAPFQEFGDFIVEQMAAVGCSEDQFEIIVGQDTNAMIDPTFFIPASGRPHLWTYGWFPDYADANTNMMLLSCGVNNSFRRECSEIDDQIVQAQYQPNSAEREALYREIQEGLFGREGEFPMIPLALSYELRAVQPWFTGPHQTNGIVGGELYDFYSIGDSPAYVALEPEFDPSYLPVASTTAAQPTPTEQPATPEPPTATPAATETPTPTVTTTPEPTATPALIASGDCTVHSIIDEKVNMRGGPGLGQVWIDFLPRGVEHPVVAQAKDSEGATWWQLENGYWVRYDIVGETGDCASVPGR